MPILDGRHRLKISPLSMISLKPTVGDELEQITVMPYVEVLLRTLVAHCHCYGSDHSSECTLLYTYTGQDANTLTVM